MPPPITALPAAITVLDVGGSHVSAAAVSVADDGFLIDHRTELPLDSSARREDILSTFRHASAQRSGTDRCAVAMPGPFDYVRGSGDFAGIGKFQALAGLDLRGVLAGMLGLGRTNVSFVNDAVAYGIGEWAFGAGRRTDRLLCLTLGTGVGSAFLDAGTAVVQGDEVPPHGEAHTIQLDGAPLEHTVSTAAMRRAYAAATGVAPSVREIFALARGDDDTAETVVRTTMVALGRALGPWISRFGATTTVIGGAISRSWDLVEPPLREGLAAVGAGSTLRPATLLDDAPLVGAAVWAARS